MRGLQRIGFPHELDENANECKDRRPRVHDFEPVSREMEDAAREIVRDEHEAEQNSSRHERADRQPEVPKGIAVPQQRMRGHVEAEPCRQRL